jgi:hypothetical protein
VRDDTRDVVECRYGAPEDLDVDARDVPMGCGAVHRAIPGTATILSLFGDPRAKRWPARSVAALIACPDDAPPVCAVRLTVTGPGDASFARRVRIRVGEQEVIYVVTTPAMRRRMLEAGRLALTFAVTSRDVRGHVRREVRSACVRPNQEIEGAC